MPPLTTRKDHRQLLSMRIATRESPLALWQARHVQGLLQGAHPGLAVTLVPMTTAGDQLLDRSLAAVGGKGLFVKELEAALLDGRADLAVHSMKDVPAQLPAGLCLGAFLPGEDPRDALVSNRYQNLDALPAGAIVGSSSLRRQAQLRSLRPDLELRELRGNVGTRLRKLAEQPELDAIVLAAAGLARLHFRSGDSAEISGDEVPSGLLASAVSVEDMLPCVGQAAIGIEIRERDARAERVCAALNHAPTQICVTAERAFLRGMGGGCQLAVGAYAEILDGKIRLRGVSFLGAKPVRGEKVGALSDATSIGESLARELL